MQYYLIEISIQLLLNELLRKEYIAKSKGEIYFSFTVYNKFISSIFRGYLIIIKVIDQCSSKKYF
jgi:isocitrate dehydrogenase kinase/phosphatase